MLSPLLGVMTPSVLSYYEMDSKLVDTYMFFDRLDEKNIMVQSILHFEEVTKPNVAESQTLLSMFS